MRPFSRLEASALLLVAAFSAPARGAEPAPLPARPAASAEATLAAGPIRLEVAAGESRANALGVATSERPAVFLFAPPVGVALTLGVSSKSGEGRLSIYEPGSERALPGTEPEAGAVRWIGMLSKPGEHRLVVHTRGAETPVRLEVSVDRHLDFAGSAEE